MVDAGCGTGGERQPVGGSRAGAPDGARDTRDHALLLWMGANLASANALVAGFIALSMGHAYRERIRSDEAMMVETFGEDY